MAYLQSIEKLAFKKETDPGVAETIADADQNIRVSDIQFTPNISMDEAARNIQNGGQRKEAAIVGTKAASISFTIKLTWGGAVDTEPNLSKVLECTGLKKTVFTTVGIGWDANISAWDQTATIEYFTNDPFLSSNSWKKHQIYGAVGDVEITAGGTGQATNLRFTFTGVYGGETDVPSASVPAGTMSTVVSESFLDCPATILGTASQCVSSYTISAGNTIEPMLCQSEEKGIKYFHITDQDPRWSLNPYQKVATSSILADAIAGTEGVTKIEYGSSNPHFTIEAENSQAMSPAQVVREGKLAWDVNLYLNGGGTFGAFRILQGATS